MTTDQQDSAQPEPMAFNDDFLRRLWREAGGKFHGPNVETGTMPESKLLPFLRAIASAAPTTQPAEPINDGPEFTDMGRSALLWVLWHHQGGSSPVGQPLRFALGMGAHDRMSDKQVAAAREWGALQDLAPGSCRECTTPAPAVAPAAVTDPQVSEALGDARKAIKCLFLEAPAEVVAAAAAKVEWAFSMLQATRTPEPQAEQGAYSYASKQATECAGCGKRKHTPLRIDAMGGYVCLTCIDQKLGTLLGEFGYPQPELDANTLGVALEKLVNDALDAGMVFSVTRRSVPPLAMGRHVAEVSVWPARGAE